MRELSIIVGSLSGTVKLLNLGKISTRYEQSIRMLTGLYSGWSQQYGRDKKTVEHVNMYISRFVSGLGDSTLATHVSNVSLTIRKLGQQNLKSDKFGL